MAPGDWSWLIFSFSFMISAQHSPKYPVHCSLYVVLCVPQTYLSWTSQLVSKSDFLLGFVSDSLFVKSDVKQNRRNKESVTLSYLIQLPCEAHAHHHRVWHVLVQLEHENKKVKHYIIYLFSVLDNGNYWHLNWYWYQFIKVFSRVE